MIYHENAEFYIIILFFDKVHFKNNVLTTTEKKL